jgi:hypothetical protein
VATWGSVGLHNPWCLMTGLALRIKRKAWKQVLGEKSWILHNEDFRAHERSGLVNRPNYAYGMLRAADGAKYFGHKSVTVIEFGVASGAGLLNMADLAGIIEAETGIKFRVIGFDTGAGLPTVQGYKDHPEIWNSGDFAMEDREGLIKKLDGRAEVIWGDIGETIKPFTAKLTSESPVGFISIDVDIYSGTKSALQVLDGSTDKYLPGISMYFDDVSFFFANKWAGELAAIEEFNAATEQRKIDHDRSLVWHRPPQLDSWYSTMYVCHMLDHPARQSPLDRPKLTIEEHAEFMKTRFLF